MLTAIHSRKKERFFEISFLLLLFTFYLGWCLLQPYGTTPDEIMRYQIPQYIYQYGALPHGGDPLIRDPQWGISYAFTPILSYMISALFMWITSAFTTAPGALLVAARMVSILCSVGTAALCMAMGKRLFQNAGLRWMFVIFVSMLPQFAFVSGYVNVDALAMLSAAMIVYAWVLGLENQWRLSACLLLAVGISICALAYYNAYGFILCSGVLFILSFFFTGGGKIEWRPMLKKGFLILGVVLLLTGWWFIRNAVLYGGDFLGVETSNQYAELYAVDQLKPSNIASPSNEGQSLFYMLFNRLWLPVTLLSFLGWFGQMSIKMELWMYAAYGMIILAGIAGCLIGFKRLFPKGKGKDGKRTVLFHSTLLTAMLLPILISAYYSYTNDFQPQGRYVLPMLIPFAYFIARGLQAVIQKWVKHEKARKWLPWLIGGLWAVMSLLCLIFMIGPAYAGMPFIRD